MYFVKLIIFSFLIAITVCQQDEINNKENSCLNSEDIVEILLDPKKYKRKIPKQLPVQVGVQIWVQDFNAISIENSDFTIDIYMSESWFDPNLSFTHLKPCKYNLTVTKNEYAQIWTPNICFVNTKKAEVQKSPLDNVFLMIYANGSVWTNYRMKVTGPCKMNLRQFPFGHVSCSLMFESFNYNVGEVNTVWIETHLVLLQQMNIPDYHFIEYRTELMRSHYPAGNWNELTTTFKFQHRYGWYILFVYVPSFFIIFISWIPFCLGSAIAARAILGMGSLIIMAIQFSISMNNLPKASFVTALDMWIFLCMIFIFVSLLELGLVGCLDSGTNQPLFTNEQLMETKMQPPKRNILAVYIDRISLCLFPMLFAIFNIVYWVHYL